MERTEPTFRCWIYFSAIGQFGFDLRSEPAVVLVVLLGSLSNMNDCNRKENVTWKENMHCLKLNRAHSVSFNSSVLASISGVEFLKTVSNFGRWERNSLSHVAHKTWNKEVIASKSCSDNKEMYNVFFEACLTSIALLTFSLASSSSLLKLPVVFAWLTCVPGLFFECSDRREPRERMSKQGIHRRLAMGFAYVDCEKGKLADYSFALDQERAKICTYHACILSFSFLLLFCFLFRLPRAGLLLLLCCFWIYTRRVYPWAKGTSSRGHPWGSPKTSSSPHSSAPWYPWSSSSDSRPSRSRCSSSRGATWLLRFTISSDDHWHRRRNFVERFLHRGFQSQGCLLCGPPLPDWTKQSDEVIYRPEGLISLNRGDRELQPALQSLLARSLVDC